MQKLPVVIILVIVAVLAVAGYVNSPTNTQYLWLADCRLGYLTLRESESFAATVTFIASVNSNVYHFPWCSHVDRIKAERRVRFPTAASAEAQGYHPCATCHPPQ